MTIACDNLPGTLGGGKPAKLHCHSGRAASRSLLHAEHCGGELCGQVQEASHVVVQHQQQPLAGEAAAAGKQVVSPIWVYACILAKGQLPCSHQVSTLSRPHQGGLCSNN